jgi:sugar O-acyltransferase (sialic acid O-acetyltransferase NeuD family)
MSRPLVIVGSGGHGRVLAEALQAEGRVVLGFVDRAATGVVLGLPVLGDDGVLDPAGGYDLVNGIGGTGAGPDPRLRRTVQERLQTAGFHFVGARHPSALVSPSADVAADAQLLAGCVVQAQATVGAGAIVNTRAVVEHGVRLGAFAHCATGAILCGDVEIGADAHVGAGAVVRQGVRLEDGVVVGAGAVVIEAGAGFGPLLGVPARRRGMT